MPGSDSAFGSLHYDEGSNSFYFGSSSCGSDGTYGSSSSENHHDGTFMRDEFPEHGDRSINNLDHEDMSQVSTEQPALCMEMGPSFFGADNPFQNCQEFVGFAGCDFEVGDSTMTLSMLCCETCKNPPPQCSDWDGVMQRLTDVGVDNCQEFAEEGYCSRVLPPGEPDITHVCCATCSTIPKDGCLALEDNQICARQDVFWGADDCDGQKDGSEYFPATVEVCERQEDEGEVWYEKVHCSRPGVLTYNEYKDPECTIPWEEHAAEHYEYGSCIVDENRNGSDEEEDYGSGSGSFMDSAVGNLRYSRRSLRSKRRRAQHVDHAMVHISWEGQCQPGDASPVTDSDEGEEDGVLCPGQPEGNFCDGDGDCVDHPDWCSCSEAQALCGNTGPALESESTERPAPKGGMERVWWSNPMPWLNIEYTGHETDVGASTAEEEALPTTKSHRWMYGIVFLAGLVMIPIYNKQRSKKNFDESMEKLLLDCEEL